MSRSLLKANRICILPPVIALAVGLAGCSDSNDPSTDSGDYPLDEYLGEGTVDFSTKGGTSVLLGATISAPEEPSAEDEQLERQHGEAVADCMADQGFEYFPFVREPVFDEVPDDEDEEFVKKNGYGITASQFGRSDRPVNPNDEIRDALPRRARVEYDLALDGDDNQPGCFRTSLNEVYGEPTGSRPPIAEFTALEDDLRALGDRIQNDKRLDEPRRAWADCMALAGYPGLEELWQSTGLIDERMNQIPGHEEWMAEIGERGARRTFDIDQSTYQDILDYETAVATADFECLEKHYNHVFDDVRRDLEADFVDDHKDDLESYRDEFASE